MNKVFAPLSFPVCLALVKMENGRKYLFRAPTSGLEKGMRVVCKTVHGEQPGVVDSLIIIRGQEALDFVLETAGVSRLEPIVGTVHVDYLPGTETYWRGKGIEKESLPVTTSSAKPGDPWITVHMPDGTAYVN